MVAGTELLLRMSRHFTLVPEGSTFAFTLSFLISVFLICFTIHMASEMIVVVPSFGSEMLVVLYEEIVFIVGHQTPTFAFKVH